MKKLLNGILNIITLIALLLTILGGVYLWLGETAQELIPLPINNVLLLIFGNGGLGVVIVFAKYLLGNHKKETDERVDGLLNLVRELRLTRENDKTEYDNQTDLLRKEINDLKTSTDKANELKEIELKVKATNPLIKKELKDKINETLGG